MRSGTAQDHARYIQGRRRMPLKPLLEPTREDELFGALRRAVPKPHEREKHKNEWISDETWRPVDERVSVRRGTRVRARIQRLVRAIRSSLNPCSHPRPPSDRDSLVDRSPRLVRNPLVLVLLPLVRFWHCPP